MSDFVPPVPVPASEVKPLYSIDHTRHAVRDCGCGRGDACRSVNVDRDRVRMRQCDAEMAPVFHASMPPRAAGDCVAMLDGRHWCDRKHDPRPKHFPVAPHHCPCGLSWGMGKPEPDFTFKDSFNMGPGEP